MTPEWREGLRKLSAEGKFLILFLSDPCPKCGDSYEFFLLDHGVRTYGHYTIVKRTCVLTNAEFIECYRQREIRKRKARTFHARQRAERRHNKCRRK